MTITATVFGGNQAVATNANFNPGSLASASGDRIVVCYGWYQTSGLTTQTGSPVTSTPTKTFTKDTEFITGTSTRMGFAVYSWVSDGTTLTQINVQPTGTAEVVTGAVFKLASDTGTVTYQSGTKGTASDNTTPFAWSAGGAISGVQIGIIMVNVENNADATWTVSSGYTHAYHFDTGTAGLPFSLEYKVGETGTPSLSVDFNDLSTIANADEMFISYQEPAGASFFRPKIIVPTVAVQRASSW